jgi:glycosyltransferase involved in cell wall biosynthesis
MKILGLISSLSDPASRVRIAQYKKPLSQLGTHLDCIIPAPSKDSGPQHPLLKKKLWDFYSIAGRLKLMPKQFAYDIVWQNRLLLYDYFIAERFIRKPFVFDMDDAIWLSEGKKQVDQAIQKATMIFAGNEYLADYCKQLNNCVQIVPSTINTEDLKPASTESSSFTLGWIGTKSNFKYLHLIRQPVVEYLGETQDTRLIIVSTEQPPMFSFDNDRIVFKKWEKEKENEYINEFSVGLMPLTDEDWTRGKCSYKMLQYMACNKSVIVSPVGLNKTILEKSNAGIGATSERQWKKAMLDLKNDDALNNYHSQNGRPFVEENYSTNKWAFIINNYFKELIK